MKNNCFDIHGNGFHRLQFEETLNGLTENQVDNEQEITVSRVLAFMKKMPEWKFASIRVLGMNSFKRWSDKRRLYWDEVKFTIGRKPFLDLYPPVQICVISKKDCNLKQWKIVHPDKYVEQFI